MVVPERIVTVPVAMRLGIDRRIVVVAVMRVMMMNVGMLDRLVEMPMAVRFTDESPDTEAAEQCRDRQPGCCRFSARSLRPPRLRLPARCRRDA
jgi:hypothetical protein